MKPRSIDCEADALTRVVEAEAGSGPFSVEAEARKFQEGRIEERKEIGSAILRRRANRGSINS